MRLRVQELATKRGLNMSQLQRKADVQWLTMRRYWYSTSNGRVQGPPLSSVALNTLYAVAAVLDVPPGELIADERAAEQRTAA